MASVDLGQGGLAVPGDGGDELRVTALGQTFHDSLFGVEGTSGCHVPTTSASFVAPNDLRVIDAHAEVVGGVRRRRIDRWSINSTPGALLSPSKPSPHPSPGRQRRHRVPTKEVTMTADPRELSELLEESEDLQADALRPTHDALDELVELNHSAHDEDRAANVAFHEEHQRSLRSSLGATTTLGAAGAVALVGVLASAAAAANSSDVQLLQTAASIENLAVATYKTALTLPYIGGSAADPVITKFAQVTMGQHAQHADAFNAAAKHLGGKAQNKPDPAFVPVVNKAVASLGSATAAQGALGVVGLALELENIAAETYIKDTALAQSTSNKALFASIMGIEAQHVSVLLAVQALLKAGAPQLISLSPGTAAALPAAAGSVGFPDAFYKTNMAAPAKQGAVK